MKLTTEAKKQIFKKFGGAETNTGTAEGQIALFTERISHMTEHMQVAKKDFSTQRALIRLVGAVLAEQHDEWAESRRYLGLASIFRPR